MTRDLCGFADNIRRDHRQLLTVFGYLKDVVLPTAEEIKRQVENVLSNLDVPIREIPFSFDAAKASFVKTIRKEPPSDRTQQFKDGVIWAHCVELLDEGNVYFVTSDKAFYEGHDYSNGLAKNLLNEIREIERNFKLLTSLTDLLKDIRVEIDIDKSALADAYFGEQSSSVTSLLERTGFAVSGAPVINLEVFATESADQVYLDFTITYRCDDSRDLGRTDAILKLHGNGTFNPVTKEFLELQNRGEELTYIDQDGKQETRNIVIAAGNVVLGHRTVQHAVRFPLS